jgi:hypothetical protein
MSDRVLLLQLDGWHVRGYLGTAAGWLSLVAARTPQVSSNFSTLPRQLTAVMRRCTHVACCSAPPSIPRNAQRLMISWQVLQISHQHCTRQCMKVQQLCCSLEAKHCNTRYSVSSMRAQQLGAGRLDHPAQSSLLTYLAICTAQIANMLGLVAALIAFWLCWPWIEWCIGTVAWLGSWYACIAECLPMLPTSSGVMQSVDIVEPTSTEYTAALAAGTASGLLSYHVSQSPRLPAPRTKRLIVPESRNCTFLLYLSPARRAGRYTRQLDCIEHVAGILVCANGLASAFYRDY